jgi:hypothetical protein
MLISELTERVTRAIEASDVSSAPPVVESTDREMHKTQPTPSEPNGAQGLGTPKHLDMTSVAPGSMTPTRPIPRRA